MFVFKSECVLNANCKGTWSENSLNSMIPNNVNMYSKSNKKNDLSYLSTMLRNTSHLFVRRDHHVWLFVVSKNKHSQFICIGNISNNPWSDYMPLLDDKTVIIYIRTSPIFYICITVAHLHNVYLFSFISTKETRICPSLYTRFNVR